ncbi:MAG: translation elongation factor Ts [Patescibacteria group bacterium]
MSTHVTTELIKELRDSTSISVMQCKNALIEADGDIKKAIAILKKTSSDIALKKADRNAKDGAVIIKSTNNKIVMISLRCETDFVSKNEDFASLLSKLSSIALTDGIDQMKKVAKEMIDPVIQKTGENIQLDEAFQIEGNILGSYVHNNKSAVVVSLDGGNNELAKDIAMHITAMKPEYLSSEDITEDIKKTMFEIFQKEIEGINKPAEIKKKMLDGKIGTYFKEKTLLDQPFIKNSEETIGQLLEKSNAKIKEIKRYSI